MSDSMNDTFPNNMTEDARKTALAMDPILRYFEFQHLPAKLSDVSRVFHKLAWELIANLPRNPERTVALRKLLESKDAAVRAMLE